MGQTALTLIKRLKTVDKLFANFNTYLTIIHQMNETTRKNYKIKIYPIYTVVEHYKSLLARKSQWGGDFYDFPSDIRSFLLSKEQLDALFTHNKLSSGDIKYVMWLIRHEEKNMIEQGLLKEDNLFYQYVQKCCEQHTHLKNEMYGFATLMTIEDKDVHSHWNFTDVIPKEYMDKLICKSLYANIDAWKKFFPVLGKERLEKVRFTPSGNTDNIFNLHEDPIEKNEVTLHLKNKVAKDVLYGYGADRTRSKKMFEIVKKDLNLDNELEQFVSSLDLATIQYYALELLDYPEFSSHYVKYVINDIEYHTTIENIAKYNAMEKSLTACINNQEAYSLTGDKYKREDFEQLVDQFANDDFLKQSIISLLKNKSLKAHKSENKSLWHYHAVRLEITQQPCNQSIKRNKI